MVKKLARIRVTSGPHSGSQGIQNGPWKAPDQGKRTGLGHLLGRNPRPCVSGPGLVAAQRAPTLSTPPHPLELENVRRSSFQGPSTFDPPPSFAFGPVSTRLGI
jgi:hypothetical protein